MTATAEPTDTFEATATQQNPGRWTITRAGIQNVWHYWDNEFIATGGRFILRGTNGSGKSRALEMLLPFLLDADRRNMGTGSAVKMEDLMRAGNQGGGTRLGYLWLELARTTSPETAIGSEDAESLDDREYLTLGALIRYSEAAAEAKVWYFTTGLRVGHDLELINAGRAPLSRKELGELIGDDRIVDSPERHREQVAARVFGATGELGKDRFDGLMKLLHTLRAPDVGNRIEEGKLPAIVSDSLPPLSESALTDAGSQLDGLKDTRARQQALEQGREEVDKLLSVYSRYVTGVLTDTAQNTKLTAAQTRIANTEVTKAADELESLAAQLSHAEAARQDLGEQRQRLEATLKGLKDSEAYKDSQNLHDRGEVVTTLGASADSALSAAADRRAEHARRVTDADRDSHEVIEAVTTVADKAADARTRLTALGLPEHNLPAAISAAVLRPTCPPATVRLSREQAPTTIERPAPVSLTLTPTDLAAITEPAELARRAAEQRHTLAINRASDAADLDKYRAKVQQAGAVADAAASAADADREHAANSASSRDQIAIELAEHWRDWVSDPATVDIFGADASWAGHPALGAVLADTTELAGTDSQVDLADLDSAPQDTARALTGGLREQAAHHDRDARTHQITLDALKDERAELLAEHDPEPARPTWQTTRSGLALWRCLDFTSPSAGQRELTAAQRAGIEGALHAAGMLTATLRPDGTLLAETGELLLTAAPANDQQEARTLNEVLRPDSALPADLAQQIHDLLASIGYRDHGAQSADKAAVWVAADGAWRNGPVTGRHQPPAARHIGAAARAAARAERIAEIDRDSAQLETTIAELTERAAELRARSRHIDTYVRDSVPRSRTLERARAAADITQASAGRSADEASRRRAAADQLAQQLAEQERRHRDLCSQWNLPLEREALLQVAGQVRDAAETCRQITNAVAGVRVALERHTRALEAAAAAEQTCDRAEADANTHWSAWQGAHAELAALQESVGKEARQVIAEIDSVTGQIATNEVRLHETDQQVRTLTGSHNDAGTALAVARAQAGAKQIDLANSAETLRVLLAAPGAIAAAIAAAAELPTFTSHDARQVESDCELLLSALKRAKTDESNLANARTAFARSMQSTYDLVESRIEQLSVIELTDAAGRRTLAEAASELQRRCEQGRLALTEREQQVFRQFVLGEVAEELRKRLLHAEGLVKAMNTSLKSIRTSHGIGVRLTWKLAEDASGDVRTIKDLVATASAVRTPVQDQQLLDLLSDRVAAAATEDPSAGSATHLRRALDYRTWHAVDVIITGPDAHQERRISRRAKLSQGETRFVSYVTLFAAVDAYLTGMTQDGSNLRLILLDDAFAKVDEPTIAELLGLLVRLDVDFVMTGHSLWGCYPQVPALDIYEVCRDEGSSAVTSRVHWDGRTQSFLRSV